MRVYFSEIEKTYLEILIERHLHKIRHKPSEWDYLKPDRLAICRHEAIFEGILEKIAEAGK